MTYLESITYLTGNFIQVCQFVVKNAYRVISLTSMKEKETAYTIHDMSKAEYAEALAKAYVVEHKGLSEQQLIAFFSSAHGLSKKDLDNLKKVLNKRDYIVSYFYIDNTSKLAREEVAIYESIIRELKEYISLAEDLNVSLSKACDRLYRDF